MMVVMGLIISYMKMTKVFEAGMDIDEFRYVDFETENRIQDESKFFKQLDVIDSQMTLELTDEDLNFQSLIEYGDL